jgi:acyl-CoA dehydrogenase
MDFSLSKETLSLLDTAKKFVEAQLHPHESRWLKQGFFASEAELKSLRLEVKKLGLWAPQMPKTDGGAGLSLVTHGLLSEVLGRSPFGHYVFGCQAPDAGNMELLHKFGTKEQKEEYLHPLINGDIRSCFSMTEPENPGSNPTQLSCMARSEGDSYVINGRKWFTSSSDGASFAIVMAVTNPDAPPHMRASMILVPTNTPGFIQVRNIPIMGHTGDGYQSHSEIVYENCKVPKTNLLGPENKGFLLAQERLGPGRIHHCMRWLGISERAFEMMCKRALSRQIEEGQNLASKQIIQAWISESRVQMNAARLMVLKTAWQIEQGSFADAQEEISLIKFYTANVMLEVVDRALQTHGALGMTDDTILAFFYAQERASRIYDGPDEVHKVAAAKRILKRYQSS